MIGMIWYDWYDDRCVKVHPSSVVEQRTQSHWLWLPPMLVVQQSPYYILPALRKMDQELKKKVGNERENFEAMKFDHLDEFLCVDYKVTVLPLFSYVQCLKAVRASTHAQLEEMWKGCYHDEEVRECV